MLRYKILSIFNFLNVFRFLIAFPGCGRFDGSNLYLGPHVFRHGENIPSNLRNSYQGLGHYSHVVETPKGNYNLILNYVNIFA